MSGKYGQGYLTSKPSPKRVGVAKLGMGRGTYQRPDRTELGSSKELLALHSVRWNLELTGEAGKKKC